MGEGGNRDGMTVEYSLVVGHDSPIVVALDLELLFEVEEMLLLSLVYADSGMYADFKP